MMGHEVQLGRLIRFAGRISRCLLRRHPTVAMAGAIVRSRDKAANPPCARYRTSADHCGSQVGYYGLTGNLTASLIDAGREKASPAKAKPKQATTTLKKTWCLETSPQTKFASPDTWPLRGFFGNDDGIGFSLTNIKTHS
jgi:hypothetical protein